jgi:hypothetical protein
MKKILFILTIALVVFSCNKNQKAVKTLDGTWKTNKYLVTTEEGTVDLFLTDDFSYTMVFEKCKLKDNDFCNLTVTQVLGEETTSSSLLYRVSEEGTVLETSQTGSIFINKYEIIELTKFKLVFKVVDEDFTAEITMKKED